MDVDSEGLENPFSIFADQPREPKKHLARSAKWTLVATLLFVSALWAHQQWRVSTAEQLIQNLPNQTTAEKINTLRTLSQYDTLAIEPLIHSLNDQSPAVAESAFNLLQELRQEWLHLPVARRAQRQLQLAQSLSLDQPPIRHAQ